MGSILHHAAEAMLLATMISLMVGDYVAGAHRENHFGNPCILCECYVSYTDRDIAVARLVELFFVSCVPHFIYTFSAPYKVAKAPYESTEDRCLATCMNDTECKVAVYGYVGGRDVFTCELYNKITHERPIYTPFTNTYFRRLGECDVPVDDFETLELEKADQRVTARKKKYIKLQQQYNPFYFG